MNNRREFLRSALAAIALPFIKLPVKPEPLPAMTWYVSDNPRFQFGFTGFKEVPTRIDVTGQYLYSSNIIVENPRSCFKLNGIT